jgi:hypothetical protein
MVGSVSIVRVIAFEFRLGLPPSWPELAARLTAFVCNAAFGKDPCNLCGPPCPSLANSFGETAGMTLIGVVVDKMDSDVPLSVSPQASSMGVARVVSLLGGTPVGFPESFVAAAATLDKDDALDPLRSPERSPLCTFFAAIVRIGL